jgi:Tol biopolymer transport system component
MSIGAIKALSVNSSGTEGNASSNNARISCDGGTVVFDSSATNLVTGDTNGQRDIFVDAIGWGSDQLSDVTISANGSNDRPALSCNGNMVAYSSGANNLTTGDANGSTDVFEYNRLVNATSIISIDNSGAQGTGNSDKPSISDDGRYVAFESENVLDTLPGLYSQTDVFIRDTKNQTTQVVSRNSNYAVGWSFVPDVSADGSYLAYANIDSSSSPYGKLLTSDTNGYQDIYISQTGF